METNKIYNVDCLEGLKKLHAESIDLVVTSPPYNIGIDYGDFNDSNQNRDYLEWFYKILKSLYRVLKKDSVLALNVGNQRNSGLPHQAWFLLRKSGFKIIKEIFWYKGLYYIQGETIFVCSKSGDYNKQNYKDDGFYANGQFATIWEMRYKNGESKKCLGHNAFFVKQLPKNFIKITTKEGDLVLDPFIGSGTVALACQEENRNFIGFEINKDYIDIANNRLSQKPIRDWFEKIKWDVEED